MLAGQGALSIREVARRVGRDVQAVHRDATTLVNAGIIERSESGVEFPYAMGASISSMMWTPRLTDAVSSERKG